MRGEVSVKELCRQHQIAETLYYSWREKLLEGGKVALAGKEERQGERALEAADSRARAHVGQEDVRARDRGGSIANAMSRVAFAGRLSRISAVALIRLERRRIVVYVGIDWATRRAAWCALDGKGGVIGEGVVPA